MITTINGVEIEHGASTEIRVRGGVVEIGFSWYDPQYYQRMAVNAAADNALNAQLMNACASDAALRNINLLQHAYNRGTTARSFIEEVLGI